MFKSIFFSILLILSHHVQAHHGLAADFDTAKEIEIEGVIDSLQWRNPHDSLKICL
jgi:hypothetical protein